MNLALIFKISSAIYFINGLLLIFFTSTFLEMAAFLITPNIITIGQVFGVAALSIGIIAFRTPDLAGSNLKEYGQIYSIISFLFVIMIGYHIFTGQASGPTAMGNIALSFIQAVLFFMFSRN